MLNWGTFNNVVQSIEVGGEWALLIGDNGSGKSTAIDALRTLLVPPRLLNYNDASADGRRVSARDRTRRSYIRGAWASSSTMDSASATTQYLRDSGTLSALLAVFVNPASRRPVTVAQLLWEHDEQVREVFFAIPKRRDLKSLLDGHARSSDIRRAAKMAGWDVTDAFSAYAERMRGLLHIPGDKALEVFNRAIGMKEAGDIDAFIRQFMLPSADTFLFIRDTVQPHYKTLLDCWTAIARAERQLELLAPIAEYAGTIGRSEHQIELCKKAQEVTTPYYTTRQIRALRDAVRQLAEQLEALGSENQYRERALADLRDERERVTAVINSSEVGVQLRQIDERVNRAEEGRRRAQIRREAADKALSLLGDIASLTDVGAFTAARSRWTQMTDAESGRSLNATERAATHKTAQDAALLARVELEKEIRSVEENRVNIPRQQLEIRQRIAEAVGLSSAELPFAGELMEVLDEYSEWTGAIERLLHDFGLSILIRESAYRAAADFVNRGRSGLRVVFHRVPERAQMSPGLKRDCVPGRLRFQTSHPLSLWVVNELVRRYDHRCCASIAELEGVDYGITREGLIRGGTRHVKDDREHISRISARILGWSTEEKLAALRRELVEATARAAELGRLRREARLEAEEADLRAKATRDLSSIVDFDEVAPQLWSEQILQLRTERQTLEEQSSELRTLQERERELRNTVESADGVLRNAHAERINMGRDLEARSILLARRESELQMFDAYDDAEAAERFSALAPDIAAFTVNESNLDEALRVSQQRLHALVNTEQRVLREAGEKLTSCMTAFLGEFAAFGQTLRAERAYTVDFMAVKERVQAEELPQHRERFEAYLNENLVGNLSMLHRRLEEHQEAIEGRLAEINDALREIEYTGASYVQLRLMNLHGTDIGEFRRALRACFEHGIAASTAERLQIFERIRELVEGFQRDPDRTGRVCDVRNWVSTGVRELRRGDDAEVNFYAATTGKSGGQKAKLAFTILASALAAQYGLSPASKDSPNFRLVIIDEAFSRTDESNSTQAMELFQSLGFQLLIVGPFDAKAKLAVPFVQSIHLASNAAGNYSTLTPLSRRDVDIAPLAQD
ncbi:MAG: hypothetical protein JWM95_1346 [Gemmatimonadetes bacterium]|nr:hypothetical protein [Gemmatimonadota bacterium]